MIEIELKMTMVQQRITENISKYDLVMRKALISIFLSITTIHMYDYDYLLFVYTNNSDKIC